MRGLVLGFCGAIGGWSWKAMVLEIQVRKPLKRCVMLLSQAPQLEVLNLKLAATQSTT